MNDQRKQLWIAMSDLWLDTELTEDAVLSIASAVRDSGLDREDLEAVFRHELAPFLGKNQQTTVGNWEGFDPDWVCRQAQERHGKRRLLDRLASAIGLTTYAARPAWNRVLKIAFEDEGQVS